MCLRLSEFPPLLHRTVTVQRLDMFDDLREGLAFSSVSMNI